MQARLTKRVMTIEDIANLAGGFLPFGGNAFLGGFGIVRLMPTKVYYFPSIFFSILSNAHSAK